MLGEVLSCNKNKYLEVNWLSQVWIAWTRTGRWSPSGTTPNSSQKGKRVARCLGIYYGHKKTYPFQQTEERGQAIFFNPLQDGVSYWTYQKKQALFPARWAQKPPVRSVELYCLQHYESRFPNQATGFMGKVRCIQKRVIPRKKGKWLKKAGINRQNSRILAKRCWDYFSIGQIESRGSGFFKGFSIWKK